MGHAHPKVVAAVQLQASKLMSCHSSMFNDARSLFLEKLISIAPGGLDRIFLSNSGAEAVEAAIKIARKATGRRQIVAMKGGFHGKTHGALSATWDRKYRKSFEPLVPDFDHVSFGDVEAAKKAITKNTAAVLVEPVQGEGGVRVPPQDWLALLRELSRESGSLLIMDEVQSGLGRTGKLFASDHFEVTPDILCLGKGLASGLPIGVTMASDSIMATLSMGEHTTTFGGNPVVSAAGAATIDALTEEHLVENSKIVGGYFRSELVRLASSRPIVREIRGLGLMIGAEMRFDVLNTLQRAMGRGVLMLDAGRNVVRFLPPLCLDRGNVDKIIAVLGEVLEEEELARIPA